MSRKHRYLYKFGDFSISARDFLPRIEFSDSSPSGSIFPLAVRKPVPIFQLSGRWFLVCPVPARIETFPNHMCVHWTDLGRRSVFCTRTLGSVSIWADDTPKLNARKSGNLSVFITASRETLPNGLRFKTSIRGRKLPADMLKSPDRYNIWRCVTIKKWSSECWSMDQNASDSTCNIVVCTKWSSFSCFRNCHLELRVSPSLQLGHSFVFRSK